ncbi:hypothetical protein [Rhodovulum sp.]|uniref:hypothetical protein n=1 Tax=Rhodovulum sp. TaxID=34009 RepID=UPI0018474D1F|nr:hypothetical protein [Rhodovulum sp.]HDR30061.1 hypothetical protein [Rhodovulum sp.]
MTGVIQMILSRGVALPGLAARGLIARGQALIEERDRARIKARLDWRAPSGRLRSCKMRRR